MLNKPGKTNLSELTKIEFFSNEHFVKINLIFAQFINITLLIDQLDFKKIALNTFFDITED